MINIAMYFIFFKPVDGVVLSRLTLVYPCNFTYILFDVRASNVTTLVTRVTR